MILTAKVEQIFPVETGTSRAGKEWKKGAILVDVTTNPEWPKKLMITLFGKAVENVKVSEGQIYDFDIDVTSREWKNPNTGKISWFTEASAFKATLSATGGSYPPSSNTAPSPVTPFQQAEAMYGTPAAEKHIFDSNPPEADDLPF